MPRVPSGFQGQLRGGYGEKGGQLRGRIEEIAFDLVRFFQLAAACDRACSKPARCLGIFIRYCGQATGGSVGMAGINHHQHFAAFKRLYFLVDIIIQHIVFACGKVGIVGD